MSPSAQGSWQLTIEIQADPAEWNATAARLGGNLFHTYQYGQTLYTSQQSWPFFARWFDATGACVGCCLGATQGPRRWPLSILFRQAHLSAFPACVDVSMRPALVLSLTRALAARRVMALTVDSYGAANWDSSELPPAAEIPRAEFCLSLAPPLEELWSNLAATRRTKINRAGRAGLELSTSRTEGDLRQLCALIGSSSDRQREYHGQPFETPGTTKITQLARQLVEPGLATIYMARKDGGVLAGSLIGCWNGQAYNMLAGSSPDGFKLSAATWLTWEILKDLKAAGVREYNLGGVAVGGDVASHAGHGLYEFKRQFGGCLRQCASPTFVLRMMRFRAYQSLARWKGIRGHRSAARGE